MKTIFECRMCGHCCEGRGGIVLSAGDQARLAEFFALELDEFLANYAEKTTPKIRLLSPEGKCIFYKTRAGCLVHPARPDICRAWPYFKGNLEDPVSFEMAKPYCDGINKNCSFKEFVEAGKSYLTENGLIYANEIEAPESLKTII